MKSYGGSQLAGNRLPFIWHGRVIRKFHQSGMPTLRPVAVNKWARSAYLRVVHFFSQLASTGGQREHASIKIVYNASSEVLLPCGQNSSRPSGVCPVSCNL